MIMSMAHSENKSVDLMRYSHNRDDDFKKTSDDLRDLIDSLADQECMSPLYDYFQKRYSLPESVVKQKLKQRIAVSYMYKSGLFSKELRLRYSVVSLMKHLGLLFYALIHSRKSINGCRFKLIVDGVGSNMEVYRFKKLIDLVGKKDVLIVTTDVAVKSEFSEYNVKLMPRFKYYDVVMVLRSIWDELFVGVWLYLCTSVRIKVNLLPVISPVVKDFLYYSTLFRNNNSDYIIQDRHYVTNSVKNYLFRRYGGYASTCIQKNIIQLDTSYYYSDIDCLFSLGKMTTERLFEYGGRIGHVIPVGSMHMEYYWFRDPMNIVTKKYDVVMLGVNMGNAYERMNSYSKFHDDYYNSIRWLVRFKNEYPAYRIAIKHHSSARREDKIESKMIFGSGIEILPKEGNSYVIAFSSRCAVTYGSTLGYELNAHGMPTFFLDHGYRCTTLPDRDDKLLDGLRFASYEGLRDALLGVLDNPNAGRPWLGNPDDLCLSSSSVSERMYKALTV